jgi:two-component system phosphate regulon response regulator PhoB
MARERILVVEDDDDILELITYNLAKEGFRCTPAQSGEDALRHVRGHDVDLVLLDLMLPGIDGLEVCSTLKRDPKFRHIPVIMLTAKGSEADVVAGLELGADDYMVKPFSPRVLVARIRAVLRRRESLGDETARPLSTGAIAIHPGRHSVTVDGTTLELTHSEFLLLHFLASHCGWVYTRAQIVENIRSDNYPVTDRSVDVMIVGLRKKLGAHGALIETVRGVGYRFKEV